ncbi:unnamed protein product [Closterium sp. NIES-53]
MSRPVATSCFAELVMVLASTSSPILLAAGPPPPSCPSSTLSCTGAAAHVLDFAVRLQVDEGLLRPHQVVRAAAVEQDHRQVFLHNCRHRLEVIAGLRRQRDGQFYDADQRTLPPHGLAPCHQRRSRYPSPRSTTWSTVSPCTACSPGKDNARPTSLGHPWCRRHRSHCGPGTRRRGDRGCGTASTPDVNFLLHDRCTWPNSSCRHPSPASRLRFHRRQAGRAAPVDHLDSSGRRSSPAAGALWTARLPTSPLAEPGCSTRSPSPARPSAVAPSRFQSNLHARRAAPRDDREGEQMYGTELRSQWGVACTLPLAKHIKLAISSRGSMAFGQQGTESDYDRRKLETAVIWRDSTRRDVGRRGRWHAALTSSDVDLQGACCRRRLQPSRVNAADFIGVNHSSLPQRASRTSVDLVTSVDAHVDAAFSVHRSRRGRSGRVFHHPHDADARLNDRQGERLLVLASQVASPRIAQPCLQGVCYTWVTCAHHGD